MKLWQQLPLVTLCVLLTSAQAYGLDFNTLKQQVTSFEESGQARFAPSSIKKVTAYLGASMLAYEKQKSSFAGNASEQEQSQTLQDAITQTQKVLHEAKSNAQIFTSTFAELLQLEGEANKVYVYHHKPQLVPDLIVSKHYKKAQQLINKAIIDTEKGLLNQARQAAKKAMLEYNKSIDIATPYLIERSSRALSQASSVGAKQFAPRLWTIAEIEFDLLEQYSDNLTLDAEDREDIKRPNKMGYAFEMSIYAQKMAIQVKALRRDNGSHEKLILTAKQNRIEIAKALQLDIEYEKVGIDIESATILQHVKRLKQTLTQERQQHKTQVLTLNADFEKRLAAELQQQRIQDQQIFQSKLVNMKSAFTSKLEQETFETKRQKSVHDLFEKDEADIIANLDGSLIVRVKKVQFSPGSSKVSGQYFDFLGRVKEALALYPDRLIRIEGHTDSLGDEKENRKLSLKRAEAVLEFLIASGIDVDRIRALGFGEVKPIASNMYKKGRTMNRRIDIIIESP